MPLMCRGFTGFMIYVMIHAPGSPQNGVKVQADNETIHWGEMKICQFYTYQSTSSINYSKLCLMHCPILKKNLFNVVDLKNLFLRFFFSFLFSSSFFLLFLRKTNPHSFFVWKTTHTKTTTAVSSLKKIPCSFLLLRVKKVESTSASSVNTHHPQWQRVLL